MLSTTSLGKVQAGLEISAFLFLSSSSVTSAQDSPPPSELDTNLTAVDPNTTPSCSVCRDGSDPVASNTPFHDIFVTVNDYTCNDIIVAAASEVQGSDTCQHIQLAAFQGGCCSESSFFTNPELFEKCTICPKGEGPGFLAFQEVPQIHSSSSSPETGFSFTTCGELSSSTNVITEFLQGYIKTPGECDNSLLRRSAGWCGCMGTSVECNLCDGKEIQMAQSHPLTGMTCRDIQYLATLLNSTECSNTSRFLNFDPEALCCPVAENNEEALSTISCPLCTTQQGLTQGKIISTDSYGQVSCGDAQAAANLLASDQQCADLRRQFSSDCCVGTPADESVVTCQLTCPETGERPTDLLLQDEVTGYTCNFLVAEYAKFTASQCVNASSILGFDAESFCCGDHEGNSGAESTPTQSDPPLPTSRPVNDNDVPINPSHDCRICPDGRELLYPQRILFAYQEQTCQHVEQTALSLTSESDCWNFLDRSRALGNCACRRPSESGDGDVTADDENAVIDVPGGSSDGCRLSYSWGAWGILLSAVSIVIGKWN
jgi:hypothetical protein